MPRMGKTDEDWNGWKLGFLKTVQPNSFSKLIPAACNFKNNAQETYLFVGSLILSFTCNFFAYFNPFAPEPPVTARADPGPFYPLWRHQF